jgi:hypothetical protein
MGTMQHSFAQEEPIYGRQLMTPEEIAEHRAGMRSLNTQEEREAYQWEHHQKMQERAQAQGITLPDEPMGMGMGQGPRAGMGRGAGTGIGQGQGQGQGQGKQ